MPDALPVAPVRLGARRSPLARAQVDQVAARLLARGVPSEFVGITTVGDVDPRALTEIGGTGVFAGAVREALVAGRIDVAVHSYKDLPTLPASGLTIAAVPAREDARDVLVGRRLADLRSGDRIGTGAPRRAVQLAAYAASRGLQLEIVPIRGNVDTRLRRVREGDCEAVVLAAAGLVRLGHADRLPPMARLSESDNRDIVVSDLPATLLGTAVMLPAAAQGALALEVRSDDPGTAGLLAPLDDALTRAAVAAERGFLASLEAGCTAPVGVHAVVNSVRGTSVDLTLAAVLERTVPSNLSELANGGQSNAPGLARTDRSAVTDDPWAFGAALARAVLAQLPSP